MKKLFTLLLALVATTALWAEDFSVGGIYYNILTDKTNEVEVTYQSTLLKGNYASLTTVTIPETVTYNGTTYSVTSIGSIAFAGCSGLTSITIGNSVTSIGDDAFWGCSGLTSVVWNAKNCADFSSPSYAPFYYPTQITSFTFGDSVEHIPANMCNSMRNLTSITIPNSVTSIGDCAFSYCSGLTSITIPNSVTSIGSSAFSGCSSLTSIVVEEGNTVYDSRENCNAIIETASNTLITGCKNTIIPNSVTSIGSYAFYHCSSLISITVPNSVTSIGNYAFQGCSSLTSITIPNSVTSIGEGAFSGCSSLTSITIPNSVTSIGDLAFYYCSGLTSIESLAEVPPTLGSYAFYNVSTTIPVYVPCGAVSAYQLAGGWEAFTNIQEPLAEHSITVGVNDSIMGTSQVDYNTYCEGAQITANHNNGYHFVQWSDGNTDNPRTLELTQDTILTAEFAQSYSGQCGDNLYWVYDEANKTISITGSGDMYDYTKSTQPWYLFQEQITEVITSVTTTSIGASAFSGCSGLTSITIPNSVTSIGEGAFEGCIRLGKVSLGYGMENIAANAFAECKRLYDIYVYATYPPFADESSFANYNVDLYIPCESKRDYEYDIVWGEFKYIECIGAESDETGGDDVTVTPGSNDVTITWPTEDEADTYSIVITKDGEVFCTLTFNSNGQLLNIAFAPGREGNHPAQYAEAAANGYRFTVTGLDESTKYAYNLDVNDSLGKTIKSYEGEFTTQSTTALDNTHSQSPMTNVQKIFRDGQLVIIRDGKTYNAQGVVMNP